MKNHKTFNAMAIALIIMFFSCIDSILAMEDKPDLNTQLWNAVDYDNEAEIIKLLDEGADVNAPNPKKQGWRTILERYVFGGSIGFQLERYVFGESIGGIAEGNMNIVVALLAAGANSKQASDKEEAYLERRNSYTYETAYIDQNQVFSLLRRIQLTPEEIQDILKRAADQNLTIRSLIASPLMKDLVTEKMKKIVEGYDENYALSLGESKQLRKAIEINIIRALVTNVSPNEIQHVIPAIIALTRRPSNVGRDIGNIIAVQLIPEIVNEKLALARQYLPNAPEVELRQEIINNINRAIAQSPRIQAAAQQPIAQ